MRYMTEAEDDLFHDKVGDEFADALAKATAEALRQFKPDIRPYVRMLLQERTSLYNPYTSDRCDAYLKGATP